MKRWLRMLSLVFSALRQQLCRPSPRCAHKSCFDELEVVPRDCQVDGIVIGTRCSARAAAIDTTSMMDVPQGGYRGKINFVDIKRTRICLIRDIFTTVYSSTIHVDADREAHAD